MDESERRELFKRWLEEYRGLVHKVVRAFASGRENQLDLFQDIALQLWRSTGAFRIVGAESTWVYKVALNTAVVYHRKGKRHRTESMPDDKSLDLPACSANANSLEDREMLELLYGAIRELPKADRSIILLNLDGSSNREIADMVGISPGYVAVKLTRIRKRLSELMRRQTDGT